VAWVRSFSGDNAVGLCTSDFADSHVVNRAESKQRYVTSSSPDGGTGTKLLSTSIVIKNEPIIYCTGAWCMGSLQSHKVFRYARE